MAASEIEKLERMVRENPKGRLFASLADAYRKDGQYPKALEVLEGGLANHPDYVSARVVLGRVHMAMGDRAKAREAFARVVQLDPESVIALKALADLAEEEGQGEEALRWSGQLLTVDPGNDEAIKQQERLAAAQPPSPPTVSAPPADAPAEVRLSGIIPMLPDEPAPAPSADAEKTAAPFEAVKPPVVKTVEIPVVQTSAPSFAAAPEPMEQAPEPLPIMPLSEEAATEKMAALVQPMDALEPTSFTGGADAPTERLAGLDPTGMGPDEVAAIGAAPGFEPNSGPLDTSDAPRASLTGLESIAGLPVDEPAPEPVAAEPGLELETEIQLGASASNEYQEDSAAETLRRRSGANEFQVASDAEVLDARAARASEAIETGGTDLAFIEPAAEAPPAPAAAPLPLVPEDPEPAATEPEPVVTESMAQLYAAQGHFAEALEVYRQLAEREPDELRFQERIVELEMYAGASAPAAAPAGDLEFITPPPPEPVAAPSSGGETVGAWFAAIFAETLPGGAAPAAPMYADGVTQDGMEPMAPAPELMAAAPPPLAAAPEPAPAPEPMLDLASAAELPATAPMGEPTRPASGSFTLSNVFDEPAPAKSGSFDDFFGAPPAAPAAPAPSSPAEAPSTRSTRPSSAQPPADDDISSFQDWLKGLKK